jgi:hypothetical protein
MRRMRQQCIISAVDINLKILGDINEDPNYCVYL